jgi:hypothetical protein
MLVMSTPSSSTTLCDVAICGTLIFGILQHVDHRDPTKAQENRGFPGSTPCIHERAAQARGGVVLRGLTEANSYGSFFVCFGQDRISSYRA